MEIGIITHWNVPNYGSFLQAYALQKFLANEYRNAEVRLVNYIKPIHIKMYYSLEAHENFRYWLINPRFYRDLLRRQKNKEEIIKSRCFLDYYENMIPHTQKYNFRTIRNVEFDYLIFGSDILWDYSVSFFGRDPTSFGVGLNANHKISYAASFGTVKDNYLHPDYVIRGLTDFENISVRDDNSSNIVNNLIEKKANVVIDPSLLWDFTHDKNVNDCSHKTERAERFIAIYGCEFSKEQIDYIRAFAKENGLKTISIDGTKEKVPWCDDYIRYEQMNPFQWCSYIRDAYAVATCAFHGLMFSLAFNKRIMFGATPFMKDKASSFLDYLGLKDILIDNQDFYKQFNWNWDYDAINEKISRLRKESMLWLKRAVEQGCAS